MAEHLPSKQDVEGSSPFARYDLTWSRMHQVNLKLTNEQVEKASQRARQAGFSDLDEYISDLVADDLRDEAQNMAHLFTPEVVAELKQISAEAAAGGKTYTSAEVRDELRKHSEAWRADHAS
jgi:predicted lipid-binding transport protein (Tim44 family)